MSEFSRREFIRSTTGAALAATPLLSLSGRSKAAPNDRVQHAAIGLGGQGRQLARTFASHGDCDVVAVCDVDPERRAKAAGELPDPDSVAQVEDFRTIIDDPNIDTISIATPDHWHTPIALAAIVAGKHVYVEKPCSHNVRESVLLDGAARKYGKCVQHGTQSRSGEGIKQAVAFLREGNLGTVRMAKAINHQFRGPIGRAEESDPPPGVNYDLWLGPAPKRPFTRNRWHYQWHWLWDYGTGDIGNDGIHQIDVARWGLGVGLPGAVSASGGQLFYDDDHETPDTQVVTFEYGHCYLLYEMRLWTNYRLEGHDNGVVFYGDKGTLEVGRNGCEVTLIGKEKEKIGGGSDLGGNVRNFIECVKTDDALGLNAPISEGAISATLCHLGNIATRVGRRLHFDAEAMECVGDAEANRLLEREYRKGYELPDIG
jgi:predicted dehydrogenase